MYEPLANKIRPKLLKEVIGQTHLIGEGKPLKIAIEQKHLFSFILWGPPGVGKTTISRLYAKSIEADYFELSATSAGKEDIRKIVEIQGNIFDRPKILFLDEIHRFNKTQQDYLLPFVESGKLYLIGATTENPSFEIISPLLSRCQVFILNPLNEEELKQIINKVAGELDEDTIHWLVNMVNGDARKVITILENTLSLYGKITAENLKQAIQSKFLRYDKKSEEHYDTISAFIKSMRASQPDAALYYLARMIEGGEDPLFIARRIVIFASEDVGLADKGALVIANAVFQACANIGYPECIINLGHGTVYLAKCKKDKSSYKAIMEALVDAKRFGNLPIPLKIRNAPTKLMKDLGYKKGYKPYDEEDYLPDKLKGKKYLEDKI
ncbi:Replication-associated recombination protein A [Candidatus Hepatincolaceae symbiont of Richtersius coronifer]